MSLRVCQNGHQFEKTSDCPVCPICSKNEMDNKFGDEFPKLSAPAFRALDKAGISSLHDLAKFTEKELLSLHGFGPKSIPALRKALKEKGLSFFQNK